MSCQTTIQFLHKVVTGRDVTLNNIGVYFQEITNQFCRPIRGTIINDNNLGIEIMLRNLMSYLLKKMIMVSFLIIG